MIYTKVVKYITSNLHFTTLFLIIYLYRMNLFHEDKSAARVYPIEHDRFCYCDLQDVAYDV